MIEVVNATLQGVLNTNMTKMNNVIIIIEIKSKGV